MIARLPINLAGRSQPQIALFLRSHCARRLPLDRLTFQRGTELRQAKHLTRTRATRCHRRRFLDSAMSPRRLPKFRRRSLSQPKIRDSFSGAGCSPSLATRKVSFLSWIQTRSDTSEHHKVSRPISTNFPRILMNSKWALLRHLPGCWPHRRTQEVMLYLNLRWTTRIGWCRNATVWCEQR